MNILTIRMGMTRCYIIQDEGTMMIDCGPPNKLSSFIKSMNKASIDPKQIKLIVQTHGHWDHIGSTKAIKAVTGAQIAMHEPDKEWLEKSLIQLPPGATAWGRVLLMLISRYMRSTQIPATKVDVVLHDEELSLAPFGVPGKVVYTPGHTDGSVSVLLETGDAFIGDLAMNGLPFGLRPGLPIFAEDIKKVKESIRLLLEKGAKTFYPGHGNPFPADIIRKALW
jgi:glyoxylase-like metal-dependent hydrolase (beta-lactamase superfamily II)